MLARALERPAQASEGNRMQEFYRAENQAVIDCNLPVFATGPTAGADAAIRWRLEEARSLARAGDTRAARLLCADIVLEHQVRLHDNRDLLCQVVAVLAHARGFQLLSRLLRAVDGRTIRVSVTAAPGSAASPPHLIRGSVLDGVEVFAIDESLFTDPSCDAVIDRWSTRLLQAGVGAREPVAA